MPDVYVPNKKDYRTFNLSDRVAITINFWDGRSTIHYVNTPHIVLTYLAPEELAELTNVLIKANIREV
jgi:hypothetical protein